MTQQPHTILYEDQTVILTEHGIIIKKSFLPFLFNKSIPYSEINDVFLLTKSIEKNQNITSYLNPFGPSLQTYQKVSFIELWIKNSKSHPTFCPQNPQLVFNMIQNKLRHQELKENINLGLDKVTKSIQQGYQGIMNKIGKFVEQTSTKISQKGHQLSQSLITREK